MAMEEQKRINTCKVLNNSYFDGNGIETFGSSKITVSNGVEDQYKETFTEDPVLLNQRIRTNNNLYEIFKNSPFWKKYSSEDGEIKKIEKADISKIFYYCKEKLDEIEKLSAFELVIAINEFFDFSYQYVCSKVISVKMKSEIYEDYYKNGMKKRMSELSSVKLF